MRLAVLALIALAGCSPDPVQTERATTGASALPDVPAREMGRIRVIDGDTFEMAGETIRIANIDAPERSPRSRCQAEAALAEVATDELGAILAGDFTGPDGATILPTLEREGRDRYGRTLARVRSVQGEDVGDAMIARNAAVRWTGRRAEWCA